MGLFSRRKSEVLVLSNQASDQAKVVAKLEKDFFKYAKEAEAKTYQSNEELVAIREVFSDKLKELRNALGSLRTKAVNLEMKSVNTSVKLGLRHLELVKNAPKKIQKKAIQEEIKVQEEIVGYTEEEERVWAEMKAEALAEKENLQKKRAA